MELKVRALEESDWDTLQLWWKIWQWPIMNKDMLPLDGCGGLMVYKNNTPIVAGFLYLSNSKVAWLDWIISSPTYKEEDRKEAKAEQPKTVAERSLARRQWLTAAVAVTAGMVRG